jgi:hypothetical protein
MSRTSLPSRFRDEDGRSLARALVVLLLLALFAGGFNLGAVAAEGRTVLCTATSASDVAGGPVDSHILADCCLAGVIPLGAALASPPPVLAAPERVPSVPTAAARDAAAEAAFSGRASARGPPRSA